MAITLLIVIFAVLVLLVALIWTFTNWKKLDEANKRFIDKNGKHIYYDRKNIDEDKK